jgi:Holliday junction resolvasome RuvABC DNA-binding subunit
MSNKIDGKIAKKTKDKIAGDCNSCGFYVYDDEYEDYDCQVNMDEDDYVRLMSDIKFECPYYQLDDEYKIVRKQM